MGNIHLVTGFAGQQHITSADQAVFNSLMFGGGQYVLAKGNQFAASIVTNNQVNVLDGDILMQGRHIRLNEATSVDLTIENGTQGQFRNDLIVVRYTKDENTGIEDANLVVIKGTPAASNPSDPAYTSGNMIDDGAILNDMPLYRVQLDGLNISGITPLFEVVEFNFDSLRDSFQTFSEQHKVNHYRTLAAIGVSDNSLNAEDAKSNLAAIYSAMPVESELWLTLASGASNSPNLWNSLMSKLQTDLSVTWTSALLVRLVKRSYVMEVFAVAQSTSYYFYEYGCTFRYYASASNYLSAFAVTRDPTGFVNSSGGNLTGGALGLADGKVRWLNNGNGYLQLSHYTKAGDNSNAAHIMMAHPKHSTQGGIDKVLRLGYRKDGGTEQYFPILHTGNIHSLYPAPNVVTGSYVGTGNGVVNIAFETPPKMLFITATVTQNSVITPILMLWARGTDRMRVFRGQEIQMVYGKWLDATPVFAISDMSGGSMIFDQTGVTYTYTAIC